MSIWMKNEKFGNLILFYWELSVAIANSFSFYFYSRKIHYKQIQEYFISSLEWRNWTGTKYNHSIHANPQKGGVIVAA